MRRSLLLSCLTLAIGVSTASADDWPQWLGPKRDGVWRETGIVEKFPAGGLKARWRTPIGAGYSGPSVAHGKVIITDRVLHKGVANPENSFGRDTVKGVERVLCLNEKDGSIVWKYEYECPYQIAYPAGPRASPIVTKDRVYTLGAMGDLLCLDLAKGTKIWHKKLPEEFEANVPVWGFAGHPLLDDDRLICLVGGNGSVVVAFHKDDGRELWKKLSAKEPGYAPPMIYEIGGKRQLILWHPESINALDPQSGELYWTQPYNGIGKKGMIKAGLSIPTPRLSGDRLFLTAFYNGPLMLKLNGVEKPEVLWRGKGSGEMPDDTDGLHSIMPTPVFKDGYIYGVCSYGELRCLDAKTGERKWSTHQYTTGKSVRWGNAFLVEHADRYFLFNEGGDLIIAKFSPEGHKEISRANILEPTNTMAGPQGRRVIWSHPAFANRSVYARNDKEIVCIPLAAN
ncbi:MAG: PQQ-like beta-propeller repeat protein [Gemmataceae bacterium]|nr:PQQ-like beta-propeller repeat protein [Gemmataceae bacterium]MCI0738168.1 PQQ-like beta-propeller repeat protein [Gemmataceae bacterium]